MSRSDWNWNPDSCEVREIANLHVCLALLRIYRGVHLRVDEIETAAAAKPFWPLFRLHPTLFREVATQYRRRGRKSRRRPGPPDDASQAHWSDELPPGRDLPVQPPDLLEPVGEAMLTEATGFQPLLDAVEATLQQQIARRPLPVEPKLELLARLLGLDESEKAFLRLCVAAQLGTLDPSAFNCARAPTRMVQATRLVTGAPNDHAVRTMLRRTGPLMRSGLLGYESFASCHDLEDLLRLSRLGLRLFDSPASTVGEIAELVLQKLAGPSGEGLEWPHLAERAELLRQLLANALATGARGINILLYGEPGTGKTQYAQKLVQSLAAFGYAVADKDADGDAATRHERLSSLMLTQLFAPKGRAVVVLDEAEDIFQADYKNPFARAMGKQEENKSWMNNLLEGNPHPVIWISNRIDHLDPAYVRRFSWCVEFPKTPRKVRAQIVRRHLEPMGCSDLLIQSVASAPTVSPGLVASAARFVTLAALRGDTVDEGVRTHLGDMVQALGDEFRAGLPERSTRYDTRYLNVEGPAAPDAVLQALERTGRGRAIFSGLPGTGKTQLAAEVAIRLGRELVYCTASDINSMWFGESERKVARMFRECDTDAEVLFLDEADTLLRSRDAAGIRPEQAVTAEFLRQVEGFKGVFICATNYQDRLDAALLRRFEFRLAFRPLDRRQRLELFCECALRWAPLDGLPQPPLDWSLRARLDRLDQLTPGDYANVVRRLGALGVDADPAAWLSELEAEHAAKPGAARAAIGFV